ncbi:NAD(P)/FAD-dependent oxidoreductase [Sphingomonas sp. KC8]|uniref:NAD(P)/FAD-dependent oxidoreductase n=1 Tax=Sphingomonas sp. KC8 TaxID=1030157 RepID=UPI000248A75D|nr:FAD-dependent monooxygenase [Sphingomonas sp. KC8]ARS28136.1 monooxygenase FAD-binding protein [Sphingomonas sp. KC8]
MRRTDALIVGGGPAGCAVAIALAKTGVRPLLIERHTAPQQIVCGGFLGHDAITELAALGIDTAALGARPIQRVRLCVGTRIAESALPFAAAGLSRVTLDAALRARAVESGAIVEIGRAARALDPGDGRHGVIRLDDGATMGADAIFLATGKHDLRGAARPRDALGADPAVGLRTRLAPTPALAAALTGVIELHAFDRGYAGLLLQDDGSANLCLSVARSRLLESGGNPTALTAALIAESPHLARRLAAAAAIADWQAVSNIPYNWCASGLNETLYRVGDQAAVIASLAGDGIAIAIASGRAAAAAWRAGETPARHASAFATRARRPLAIAGAIRSLAEHRHRTLLVRAAALPGVMAIAVRLTRISH